MNDYLLILTARKQELAVAERRGRQRREWRLIRQSASIEAALGALRLQLQTV